MQSPDSPASIDKFASELHQLTTWYTEKRQALITAYNESQDPDRSAVYTERVIRLFKDYIPRLFALANKARGTVSGLRARTTHLQLVWAVEPGAELKFKLTEDLIRIEGKNPDMASTLSKLGKQGHGLDQPTHQKKFLALLLEAERISPYSGVKAQAVYERAKALHFFSKKPEALALMRQVVAKYPTTSAAAEAKNTLFEQKHIQIGRVAPDIAGKDQNGIPFKLSDYRGKVVILDFWGFW